MLTRSLSALLGLLHTFNGLFMVIASRAWYEQIPGVTSTGPFNPHFVMDIGLAFFASGVAFLLFAWRPGLQLLALGASGFVVLHAGLHLSLMLQGHTANLLSTTLNVLAPAVLGLVLTWPRKEVFYAR